MKTVNIEKHNLLIVDDEPDIFWVMEHLLKQEGFFLMRALNGIETIELMERQHFELVFLDAKLPDIEGLSLAKTIKNMDPTVPIVLISGYFSLDDEIVQESLSCGLISDYISKPFQHSQILDLVKNLCVS